MADNPGELEMGYSDLKMVAEAADQLRLSDRAVYELCRAGKLRHLRLGRGSGAIRIEQADIDAYRKSCVVGGDLVAPTSQETTRSEHTNNQGS